MDLGHIFLQPEPNLRHFNKLLSQDKTTVGGFTAIEYFLETEAHIDISSALNLVYRYAKPLHLSQSFLFCLFFLLPMHEIQELTVHLMPIDMLHCNDIINVHFTYHWI